MSGIPQEQSQDHYNRLTSFFHDNCRYLFQPNSGINSSIVEGRNVLLQELQQAGLNFDRLRIQTSRSRDVGMAATGSLGHYTREDAEALNLQRPLSTKIKDASGELSGIPAHEMYGFLGTTFTRNSGGDLEHAVILNNMDFSIDDEKVQEEIVRVFSDLGGEELTLPAPSGISGGGRWDRGEQRPQIQYVQYSEVLRIIMDSSGGSAENDALSVLNFPEYVVENLEDAAASETNLARALKAIGNKYGEDNALTLYKNTLESLAKSIVETNFSIGEVYWNKIRNSQRIGVEEMRQLMAIRDSSPKDEISRIFGLPLMEIVTAALIGGRGIAENGEGYSSKVSSLAALIQEETIKRLAEMVESTWGYKTARVAFSENGITDTEVSSFRREVKRRLREEVSQTGASIGEQLAEFDIPTADPDMMAAMIVRIDQQLGCGLQSAAQKARNIMYLGAWIASSHLTVGEPIEGGQGERPSHRSPSMYPDAQGLTRLGREALGIPEFVQLNRDTYDYNVHEIFITQAEILKRLLSRR